MKLKIGWDAPPVCSYFMKHVSSSRLTLFMDKKLLSFSQISSKMCHYGVKLFIFVGG